MSENGLPAPVRDFVVRHITSVEQLELLILLASDPQKNRTVEQIVAQIRSSHESINQRIKQLLRAGLLVEADGGFRFAPASPEDAAVVRELAVAYREYRVRVIELIYSGAGPLKSFSDAFKIKPKE
jgi:hypothetical protein